MIKSHQVIDVSRKEKIMDIRILLAKAKELIGKKQELRQKFIEVYIEGQKEDEELTEKRGDFRVTTRELDSELTDVIIEIAKGAKGLEEIRIDLQRLDIIDLQQEGPA